MFPSPGDLPNPGIELRSPAMQADSLSSEPPGKVGSDGKESSCNVGELGLIPGLGRSPGEGNGYSLQYSCLENSVDRGAGQATVYGVPKSRTLLSN